MTILFILGGILVPALLAGVIIAIGYITSGYNPLGETISRLAIYGAPYAELVIVSFIVYGIFICAIAYGSYRTLRNRKHAKTFGALLAIHGAGMILAAVFRDNVHPQGMWPVIEDVLHNTLASISYMAFLMGILITTIYTFRDVTLKPIVLLGCLVIVINIPLPAILIMDRFELIDGLVQRLTFAISLLWLVAVSLQLFRLNRHLAKTQT